MARTQDKTANRTVPKKDWNKIILFSLVLLILMIAISISAFKYISNQEKNVDGTTLKNAELEISTPAQTAAVLEERTLFAARQAGSIKIDAPQKEIRSIRTISPKNQTIKLSGRDTRITTQIIAVETASKAATPAEISLVKSGPVNTILYCQNFADDNCAAWQESSIGFTQNSTHIFFSVPHFTAYAGGWVNATQQVSAYSTDYNRTTSVGSNISLASALWNITSVSGTLNSVIVDSSGVYASGDGGRVEKRNLSDGSIIWNNTRNPSFNIQEIYSDSEGVYAAGFVLNAWVIEKMNLTDGSRIWNITSDPSVNQDRAQSVAVDISGVYAAGYDSIPGLTDTQWRIEKRNLTDGTSIWNATNNPAVGSTDIISSIAVDSSGVYAAGYDSVPGNNQWRIEKRNLTTGNLIWTATSNPSGSTDRILDIATDDSYVYSVGYDSSLSATNTQWRVEKRNLTDGSHIWNVTSDPTAGTDIPNAVSVDTSGLYIAGFDNTSSRQWRIEKRNLTDGSYIWNITYNPSSGFDEIYGLAVDSSAIYAGGYDSAGSSKWRIEKRNKDDGSYNPPPHALSGRYSSSFGINQSVIWDRIHYHNSSPEGTNITYQISTSDDNSTWTSFIGPDMTSGTYYSNSGDELNATNSRYIRYMFYLATNDTASTPILSNITVKYYYPTMPNGTQKSETSKLVIWDDSESTQQYTNSQVKFYANYTNFTQGQSIARELAADSSVLLLMHLNNDSLYGENDTLAYDFSLSGFNGTIGGAVWNSSGKLRGAYRFDGINDYISLGNKLDLIGTENFTIESWFKTTDTTANPITIAGKSRNTTPYAGYLLDLNGVTATVGDAGKITFALVDGSTTVLRRQTVAKYNDGLWHHAVVTYDGSKSRSGMLVYVDGALASVTDHDSSSFAGSLSTTAPFEIGARDGIFQPFNGSIDEVIMYNRTLSASEILAHYSQTKAQHCIISENSSGSWSAISNMTFNWTSMLYEIPLSLDYASTRAFNITCNATESGFDILSAIDSFNLSARDTCNPNGDNLFINTTVNCDSKTIDVPYLNITSAGRLVLTNVSLVAGKTEIKGIFEMHNSHNTIWQNGNLTISGVYVLDNSTLRMNVSSDGEYGINVTGTMLIVNGSNITNGDDVAKGYFFRVYPNANFTLQDSYVDSAGYGVVAGEYDTRGLWINANNTFLKNATITANIYNYSIGLILYKNQNTTMMDSRITNTALFSAVWLYSSSNNTFIGNNIASINSSSIFHAFSLQEFSSDNNFTNNIFIANGYSGIDLSQSSHNIFINNAMNSTQRDSAGIALSSNHNMFINNSFYSVGFQRAAIIISSSTNNTFINNSMLSLGSGYGLQLQSGANYGNFSNNYISSVSAYAIYLSSADHNWLANNELSSDTSTGGFLDSSANNIFANNTVSSISSTGIFLRNSPSNIFANNTIISNSSIAVHLYASNYSVFDGNTINSTSGYGLLVNKTRFSNFTDNLVFSNGSYGVYLSSSSNDWFNKNNISSNASFGVYLLSSSSNKFLMNSMSSDKSYGSYLSSSSYNELVNGTIFSNINIGNHLNSATYNNFSGNSILSRSSTANYIYSSSNNRYTNNTIFSIQGIGNLIYLGSNSNTFTDNVLASNSSGKGNSIDGSATSNDNNQFFYNRISSRLDVASYQYAGWNSVFIGNNMSSLQAEGTRLMWAYSSTYTNNTISSLSNYALSLLNYDSSNSNNIFTGNLIMSNLSEAIHFSASPKNWFISNTIISNFGVGIVFTTSTSNTTFIGCNISGRLADVNLTGGSFENYMINLTFNKSQMFSPSGSVKVSWYLQVHANNTAGTNLADANISVFNNTIGASNTTTTDVNGWTPSILLTEYMQNSTGIYPQTNYTINASHDSLFKSQQINLTQSYKLYLTLVLPPPLISVQNPVNNSGYNVLNQSLNYTISGNSIDACWFVNSTGSTINLASCDNTTFIASQGLQNITAYINNTENSIASQQIFFTVDTIKPVLSVQSPVNASTYATNNLSLNFTASDANGMDSCWFVNSTGSTINIASCANTTFIASEGLQNITVYTNDSMNNVNSSQIFFSVDTIKPVIQFISPTLSNNSLINYAWNYINVSVSDASQTSAFIDFNRSLVGYWSFENGFNDSSTYGNNGTCSGASCPTLTTGKFGKAYSFDGVDDYVNLTKNTLFNSTQITVCTWIKRKSTIENQHYCLVRDSLHAASDWTLEIPSSGGGFTTDYIVWTWYNVDAAGWSNWHGVQSNDLASNLLTLDAWTFVCAVRAGNGVPLNSSLYVNGVDVSGTRFGSLSQKKNYNIPVYVGGSPSAAANKFNGSIDEVRIFNRALSDEEINASFNAGIYRLERNFTDLSDGNYEYSASSIDAAGNLNRTETRYLTIDTINPAVSIYSPMNNSMQPATVLIDYTIYDANLDLCNYINATGQIISLGFCSNTSQPGPDEGIDAYVRINDDWDGYNNNLNHGTDPYLEFRRLDINSFDRNVYLKFSDLPSVQVRNATLSMYLYTNPVNLTRTIEIKKVTSSWIETAITAASQPTSSAGAYSSKIVSDTGWKTWDVTSLVNDWIANSSTNYGLMMYFVETGDWDAMAFYSSDYSDAEFRPKLEFSLFPISQTTTDGYWNVTVYANDTANNQNSSTIFYYVDTLGPQINVQSPINASFYNISNISLNFTISDLNLDACWFENSTGAIINLPACANTTIFALEGEQNITIYANDTAGNLNFTQVFFSADTMSPIILVQVPSNASFYNTNNISLNFTVSDPNIDQCWYANITGDIINLPACANTTTIGIEGGNTISLFANDTFGNGNYTNLTFFIDTINPATTDNSTQSSHWFVDSDATIMLNATDDSFNATYYCSYNTWESPCTSFTESFTNPTTAIVSCNANSACQKLTRYYSVDKAGNIESSIKETTDIIYLVKGSYVNNTNATNTTISDNSRITDSVLFNTSISSSTIINSSLSNGAFDRSIIQDAQLCNGMSAQSATIKDNLLSSGRVIYAGNSYYSPANIASICSGLKPSSGVLSANSTIVKNNGSIKFTYTGTVGASVILNLTNLDSSNQSISLIDTLNNGVYTGNYTISSSNNIADGQKQVLAAVNDNLGNLLQAYLNLTLDNTLPSGTMSINGGDSSVSSRNVILSFNYSDANGISLCRFANDAIPSGAWESCTPTKAWLLTSGLGTKSVFAQIQDNAGNILLLNDTINYASGGDLTAPMIEYVKDGLQSLDLDYVNSNTTLSARWSAIDYESSYLSYQYRILANGTQFYPAPYPGFNGASEIWSMDGDASDLFGNGTDGTILGGADCTATGKFGSACKLNGIDSWIQIANRPTIGSNPFTIELWVKSSTASTFSGLVTGETDFTFFFGLSPNARLIILTPANWGGVEGITNISDGNWHNILITGDGATIYGYVDGISEITIGQSNIGATIWDVGSHLASYAYYDGSIDELRFYDRFMTQSDVLANLQLIDASAYASAGASTSVIANNLNLDANTTYSFELVATNTNNLSSNMTSDGVVVDLHNPTIVSLISITHPNENITYQNTTAIFEWNATDNYIVSGYSYVLDQNRYTVPDSIIETANLFSNFTNLSLGNYYFHLKAIDAAGNYVVSHKKIIVGAGGYTIQLQELPETTTESCKILNVTSSDLLDVFIYQTGVLMDDLVFNGTSDDYFNACFTEGLNIFVANATTPQGFVITSNIIHTLKTTPQSANLSFSLSFNAVGDTLTKMAYLNMGDYTFGLASDSGIASPAGNPISISANESGSAYVFMARPGAKLETKNSLLEDKEFLDEPIPFFGPSLDSQKYTISALLSYGDVLFVGNNSLGTGRHSLVVTNQGITDDGREIFSVRPR